VSVEIHDAAVRQVDTGRTTAGLIIVGGSISLSSPILFLLRRRWRDPGVTIVSWIAIIVFTLVLWLHGNPGGWQFFARGYLRCPLFGFFDRGEAHRFRVLT
jgi:hypothetical protein